MHYPLSIIHYSLPFPPPQHQAPKAQKSLKALWSPWREIFYCACFDNYANIFSDFNKSTIHLFSLPHTHKHTHLHTYIHKLSASVINNYKSSPRTAPFSAAHFSPSGQVQFDTQLSAARLGNLLQELEKELLSWSWSWWWWWTRGKCSMKTPVITV